MPPDPDYYGSAKWIADRWAAENAIAQQQALWRSEAMIPQHIASLTTAELQRLETDERVNPRYLPLITKELHRRREE